MDKRPKIGNTILIWFYAAILLVFLLVALGFNFAVRSHVASVLNSELEQAKQKVVQFAGELGSSGGPGRRSMFHMQMREESGASGANILFLDEKRNLTLGLVRMTAQSAPGMHGPQGSDYLSLEPAAYRESLAVYGYITDTSYDLKDASVKTAGIGGSRYYLQSIPFSITAGQEEYVLAFIDAGLYDRFIRNAMRILGLIMGPVLLLAFFVVRGLARHFAGPIGRLQQLSARLGSGVFEGEDLDLREQELADLNHSLNDTAIKLKAYHDSQKTFFQNASHELRTPLTAIRGYAEGIRYRVFGQDEAAEVILRESERLEHLVEDILYLSRLESDESLIQEKNRLSLSDLLLEVKENASPEAALRGKTIAVEIGPDAEILVYDEELERALYNLLTNALRYARSGVLIKGQVRDNDVLITVSDDGPGIVPGTEDMIFRRFYKGAGGSHGIGLAIAKAAVERHGGTISAQRPAEGGAAFTIVLPRS